MFEESTVRIAAAISPPSKSFLARWSTISRRYAHRCLLEYSCVLSKQFGRLTSNVNSNEHFRICNKHKDILRYYCIACDEACCGDSIALNGMHSGHELKVLSDLQDEFNANHQLLRNELRGAEEQSSRTASDILAGCKRRVSEKAIYNALIFSTLRTSTSI